MADIVGAEDVTGTRRLVWRAAWEAAVMSRDDWPEQRKGGQHDQQRHPHPSQSLPRG